MKVAFHFFADAPEYEDVNYAFEVLDKFFRLLLATKEVRIHLKISAGDLLAYDFAHTSKQRHELAKRILGLDYPVWREIVDPEIFISRMYSANIFVLAVDGLSMSLRNHLIEALRHDETYMGAIQIYEADGAHWVLYNQSLIPKYRYIEGHLRIFYTMGDESTKDLDLESMWQELPFLSVTWESLMTRHTVLDANDTFEGVQRAMELSEILSTDLIQLANDILLRLSDIGPQLQNTLFSAFRVFHMIDTPEDCAQVALSCRRFLTGLADCLYPPQPKQPNQHDLGPDKYRNRLWQYVSENLEGASKNLVLAELDDVGKRIDKLDDLANKGLHATIQPSEVHRLLMALLSLTYDLLWLTPPPHELPIDPESEKILMSFFRRNPRKNVDSELDHEQQAPKE